MIVFLNVNKKLLIQDEKLAGVDQKTYKGS
jgi:hypothetical protein